MRVVVAGAGIAGLETLVGLRTMAGERVQLTLVAPVDSFAYRPLSTASPFTFRDERRLSLRDLVQGIGADFVRDGVAYVDVDRRRVLTGNGDLLPFDAVVLAMGVRHSPQTPDWQWTRGPAGPPLFARLLKEIESGRARRVGMIVPAGAAWPADAYELGLVAARATRRTPNGEVVLLTSEQDPLEALGPAASEAVREALSDARVGLRTGVELGAEQAGEDAGLDAFSAAVARVPGTWERSRDDRGTVLRPIGGEPERFDRVITLRTAHGPAVGGLPNDPKGFLPVDEHSRVTGASGVFAVGDATNMRLKHSGLAAAQADAAAAAIASEAGADVDPAPWSPTLYGILAVPPHFPGRRESVWLDGGEPVTHCLWWPPGHVTGRHLAPYVAERDPVVRTGLLWHPPGIPVAADVAGPTATERPSSAPGTPADTVDRDALARQLLAIGRTQRAGERLIGTLERDGAAFERRNREVVARLEAAGYLRHDPDARPGGVR